MKPLVVFCISLCCLLISCQSPQRADPGASGIVAAPPVTPTPDASGADSTVTTSGQAVIRVNGMSCPNCANYIGYELKKIKGVRDVTFDLGKGTVTAAYFGRAPSENALKKAVTDSGFTYVSADAGAARPTVAVKTCEACTCGDCKCGRGGQCKTGCVCG